jgi:hypothetical protein
MTDRAPKDPRKLLVVKPARFDEVVGYALYVDVDFHFSRTDERFLCGIVPPEAGAIDGAADHVVRAMEWLEAHPEDPRVASVSPPVDQFYYLQHRAWEAVRATADETSRILVTKSIQVWRDVNDLQREHLSEPWMRDTQTVAQMLDKRDAWIAKYSGEDEDDELEEGAAQ